MGSNLPPSARDKSVPVQPWWLRAAKRLRITVVVNAEKAVLADTIQVAGNFNMTPVAARSWDRERLSAAACAAMLLFTASAAALVPEPYTSLIARWFLFVSVAAALAWLYYRLLRKARLMLYEQILVPHSIGATLSGLRLLWPSIIVTATSFTLWQALNKREERSRRAEVTATGWTGSASGINDGNEVELEPESWGAGPRNQGAQVTLLAPFSLSGIRLSDDGLLHLSLSITGNVHFVYVVPNETWIGSGSIPEHSASRSVSGRFCGDCTTEARMPMS